MERSKQATVVDVARLAGVAPGTVSHVLTGARRVRPDTRSRVEHAIAELNFRPNRVAGSLSSGRTATFALVVPDIANPYFAELVRGASDRLSVDGYEVIVGSTDDSAEREDSVVSRLLERRVDAFIIAIASPARLEHVQSAAETAPVVLVDRTVDGWESDGAWGKDEDGTRLAARHLYDLGHRRIGLVAGDQMTSTGVKRSGAFLGMLASLGLSPVFTTFGAFTASSARERVAPLLARYAPTAIAANNDLMAFGVLAAAHDAGFVVPRDLSVIGYDGVGFGEYSAPPLTTIANPPSRLGAVAAEVALARLADPVKPVQRVYVEPSLVVRRSTAPPRSL